DLNKAISLLDHEKSESTQLGYWGTLALQTRFYLYTKQYDKVIAPAEEIMNSGQFGIVGPNNYESAWKSGSGPVSLFELALPVPTVWVRITLPVYIVRPTTEM